MGLGAEAEVVGFADGAWTLRTLRDGALVRADETDVLFDYALLALRGAPRAPHLPAGPDSLRPVDAQGACGRGLVAAAPFAAGAVLFSERPLVITPSADGHLWSARWRVYLALRAAAARDARGSGGGERAPGATALAAFDDLSPGPPPMRARVGGEAARLGSYDGTAKANGEFVVETFRKY